MTRTLVAIAVSVAIQVGCGTSSSQNHTADTTGSTGSNQLVAQGGQASGGALPVDAGGFASASAGSNPVTGGAQNSDSGPIVYNGGTASTSGGSSGFSSTAGNSGVTTSEFGGTQSSGGSELLAGSTHAGGTMLLQTSGGNAPAGGSDTGPSTTGGTIATTGTTDVNSGVGGAELSNSGGETSASKCDLCSGPCLADGQCVECVSTTDCAVGKVCDSTNYRCVDCLPSSDTCPKGQYCVQDMTCEQGCKTGADCASGTCSDTHECEHCVSSEECLAGRVCGTAGCSPACVPESPSCDANSTCCGDACANTAWDVSNCGGCGTTCASNEYCGRGGCAATVLANVCGMAKVALLQDQTIGDQVVNQSIGAAMITNCVPAITAREVLADDSSVLVNPSTGQPLRGPELIVATGGPGIQALAAFLDSSEQSPLYLNFTGSTFQFLSRESTSPIVEIPTSDLTPSHDYFSIQLVRDATTGTPSLVIYGLHLEGTVAAGWFFTNVILPSLSNWTHSSYLYEFTDNAPAGPDAGDLFELIYTAPA